MTPAELNTAWMTLRTLTEAYEAATRGPDSARVTAPDLVFRTYRSLVALERQISEAASVPGPARALRDVLCILRHEWGDAVDEASQIRARLR